MTAASAAKTAARRGAQSVLGAALVLAPRLAAACAVCMSGREDETRVAFLVTTIVLSVLPVAAVGGLVLWLRRRARELERGRPAAPDALQRASVSAAGGSTGA